MVDAYKIQTCAMYVDWVFYEMLEKMCTSTFKHFPFKIILVLGNYDVHSSEYNSRWMNECLLQCLCNAIKLILLRWRNNMFCTCGCRFCCRSVWTFYFPDVFIRQTIRLTQSIVAVEWWTCTHERSKNFLYNENAIKVIASTISVQLELKALTRV